MQIYTLPISSLWSEKENRLLSHVSKKRQRKIMRYYYISDRKLSLYAALTARMGLSMLTGLPNAELAFDCLPNHKPKLLNIADYDFNFAHTHNFVLCGISNKGAVGADVEKITTAPFEVMEQVFHSDEIQYVEQAASEQKSSCFYKVWTRKEAYTKQLGTGLVYNLTACNTLSSLHCYIHTWQEADYLCSVCSEVFEPFWINPISEEDIWNYFELNVYPSEGAYLQL